MSNSFQDLQMMGTENSSLVQKSYEKIYRQAIDVSKVDNENQKDIHHLNLGIHNINHDFLVNLCIELLKYNSINKLTITLRDITTTEQLPFYLQLLAYIIQNLVKAKHIILRELEQSITTDLFLAFIKLFQSYTNLNALTIIMNKLDEELDPNYEQSLILFGQELGVFNSLVELKLNLYRYKITENNIYEVLCGISDCYNLQKLKINLMQNELSNEAFSILSSIVINCNNITHLNLSLQIYNNQTNVQTLSFLSFMKVLTHLSLYIELIFDWNDQKDEEIDFLNSNQSLNLIENHSIVQFNMEIYDDEEQYYENSGYFGAELIRSFKQLEKLCLNLSNSYENNIIKYGEAISECINIKSLNLQLSFANEDEINQFCNQIKKCTKITEINLKNITNFDLSIGSTSQIIQSYPNLQILFLEFSRVNKNEDEFNKLMEKIGQIKYLKKLSIKVSQNNIIKINPEQFQTSIKFNKYLNTIIFDFSSLRRIPKLIDWEVPEYQYPLCGRSSYYDNIKILDQTREFIKKMSLARAFKSNIRLVKIDYQNIYKHSDSIVFDYYHDDQMSNDDEHGYYKHKYH